MTTVLGQKLKVEWETEMTAEFLCVMIRSYLSPCLGNMSDTFPLVVFNCVVSGHAVHFILVYIFEDPVFCWQHHFVNDVDIWRIKSRRFHDLSEHCHSVVHVVLLIFK